MIDLNMLEIDTDGDAVHGKAGDAVEEVSKGEVDNEDGGVSEGCSPEAQYLVALSPGNGEDG